MALADDVTSWLGHKFDSEIRCAIQSRSEPLPKKVNKKDVNYLPV
jgi:hypothetical protein